MSVAGEDCNSVETVLYFYYTVSLIDYFYILNVFSLFLIECCL